MSERLARTYAPSPGRLSRPARRAIVARGCHPKSHQRPTSRLPHGEQNKTCLPIPQRAARPETHKDRAFVKPFRVVHPKRPTKCARDKLDAGSRSTFQVIGRLWGRVASRRRQPWPCWELRTDHQQSSSQKFLATNIACGLWDASEPSFAGPCC